MEVFTQTLMEEGLPYEMVNKLPVMHKVKKAFSNQSNVLKHV